MLKADRSVLEVLLFPSTCTNKPSTTPLPAPLFTPSPGPAGAAPSCAESLQSPTEGPRSPQDLALPHGPGQVSRVSCLSCGCQPAGSVLQTPSVWKGKGGSCSLCCLPCTPHILPHSLTFTPSSDQQDLGEPILPGLIFLPAGPSPTPAKPKAAYVDIKGLPQRSLGAWSQEGRPGEGGHSEHPVLSRPGLGGRISVA